MKGIINKGIQEMVVAQYGEGAWEEIKNRAGCDEPFFAVSQGYPDEVTLALIEAAAGLTGTPAEDIMVEFGKFVLPNTVKRHYPTFFALAGNSARAFLLNMGRVHEQVTRSMRDASPPRFEYEELPDGRLLMHYDSKRGLCHVLRGLILGVGLYFDTPLEVRELECMHKGGARCTMEVTFPGE